MRRTRAGLLAVVVTASVSGVVPGPVAVVPAAAAAPDIVFDGEAGSLAGITETGAAAVVPAAARNGGGGLRIDADAAPGFARWGADVLPQERTHASFRLWVRVDSRAPGESVDVVTVRNSVGSAHFDLFVSGDDGRFRWDLFRDDTDQTSWAVTFGRWYLVEAQVEFEGGTHTAAVRIDGVHQGTISSAGPAATVRSFMVGTPLVKTHRQDYDDVALAVANGPSGWLATTPPSVSIATPGPGAVLSSGQAVPADFDCTSPLFPVTSCVGTVVDGAAVPVGSVGTRTFTVTATDQAGHTTTLSRTYQVVDGIRPAVAVASPTEGRLVALGAPLRASYGCVDEAGGSGLPPDTGCVGSVAPGARLDTSSLGLRTVTVTATDRAGNSRTVERTYVVVPNRPDAHLRHARDRTFVGDGVYDAGARRQVRQARVRRGGSTTFAVRVQNDGQATDRLRVRGGATDARFRVRYFDGARNVTRAVRRGTYEVRGLAPGQLRVLRVVVSPTARAGAGDQRAVTVRVRPVGRAGPVDAVRMEVRRR